MYRTLFYTSITLDTNTGNLRRMILPDSPHRTNFCTTSAIDARIGRNRFCFQEIHHLFIPSFGFIISTVIRSPLSRNLYSGKFSWLQYSSHDLCRKLFCLFQIFPVGTPGSQPGRERMLTDKSRSSYRMKPSISLNIIQFDERIPIGPIPINHNRYRPGPITLPGSQVVQ